MGTTHPSASLVLVPPARAAFTLHPPKCPHMGSPAHTPACALLTSGRADALEHPSLFQVSLLSLCPEGSHGVTPSFSTALALSLSLGWGGCAGQMLPVKLMGCCLQPLCGSKPGQCWCVHGPV